MINKYKYEHYVVSKTHDYTRSLIFPAEFNIYLPKWEQRWAMRHRCSNTDIAEQWDMKPLEIKGEGLLGPGNIYSLWILGYIPLSLHKLRMQDEHLAGGWTRWWCRLENKSAAWYWRPLWGKLTQQRARVMRELVLFLQRRVE